MTDRKKELEKELDDIQKEIEVSLNDISNDIHRWTDARYWVHRYPLQMAGASLAIGFLLSTMIGGKRKSSNGGRGGLTTLFVSELGRYASRSAAKYMVKLIEENVERTRRANEV
ncbi:MAG: hypothetical protein WD267_13370 [Balneolales bacterium]